MREIRNEAHRQQEEPRPDDDAAQPGREAHADEAITETPRPSDSAAGLEQITETEEVQDRNRRQRREADHQYRGAEDPLRKTDEGPEQARWEIVLQRRRQRLERPLDRLDGR